MHFKKFKTFFFWKQGEKSSFLFWVRGGMDVFFSILGHG